MRLCLLLLLCVAACGSDNDYGSATPSENATITIGDVVFTVTDWRYQVAHDPNAGKLMMTASNGDTCALANNPNLPNLRMVRIDAFVYSNTAHAYTLAPSSPGAYPIEVDATLGPAGSVAFYATNGTGQPITPTNQPINPTTSFADNGNVTIAVFDPNSQAAVQGSALGAIDGTPFYYTFTANPCP
jgi:hypothetical protein